MVPVEQILVLFQIYSGQLTFFGVEKVRHVDCHLQTASEDVGTLLGLREVSTLKVKNLYPSYSAISLPEYIKHRDESIITLLRTGDIYLLESTCMRNK
jgi:hypothetical protein